MATDSNYTYNLIMTDGDGEFQHDIPQGYKFLSVINGTRNTLTIYQEATTRSAAVPAAITVQVPMFTMMTIPLLHTGEKFTYIWDDGGQVGIKFAQLMYSNTNLNINGLIGSPGSTGTVTITSDGVGLARKKQLPEELSANGSLKVSVQDGFNVSGLAQKTQLPDKLGSSGGIKTEIVGGLDVKVQVPVDSSKEWGTGSVTPGSVASLPVRACREVSIIADSTNTDPIKFGDSVSTCVVPLPPGGSVTLPVVDMSMVFVQSDQAAKLYYVWRS